MIFIKPLVSRSLADDELLKTPVRKRMRSIQIDNELLASYASNLQVSQLWDILFNKRHTPCGFYNMKN